MIPLTTTLTVNALSSGATGLLLIGAARPAADLFGVSETAPFTAVGWFLVLFALFVYGVRWQRPHRTGAVRLIVWLDSLWVLGSAVAILLLQSSVSTIGLGLIAAVALWVAAMAYLQHKGIRKGSTGSAPAF